MYAARRLISGMGEFVNEWNRLSAAKTGGLLSRSLLADPALPVAT